jgi:hypothetical protein
MAAAPRLRGRSRANPLPRNEQLLLAKRRQRQRERAQGVECVELKLPAPYGELLRRQKDDAKFQRALRALLDRGARRLPRAAAPPAEIWLADYPQLRLLAWSRRPNLRAIAPEDAIGLYEANWRFLDFSSLSNRERALIRLLADRYRAGVLNVRGDWGLVDG